MRMAISSSSHSKVVLLMIPPEHGFLPNAACDWHQSCSAIMLPHACMLDEGWMHHHLQYACSTHPCGSAGALDITTEMGRLHVAPKEICVIQRGMHFSVDLPQAGPARGYVLELFEGHFVLPELGPIGTPPESEVAIQAA